MVKSCRFLSTGDASPVGRMASAISGLDHLSGALNILAGSVLPAQSKSVLARQP
jgi:hypothetical protein